MIGLRKILVSACVGLILDIGCCARALAVVSTSSGTLSSKLNRRPRREDQDEDIDMKAARMKRGLTSTSSSSSSRRKSTTRPGRFLMRTLLGGRKTGRALTALALASALQHSGPSDGQSPRAGGLLPVAEAGNLPVVGSRGITQFVYGGSEDFVEPGADSAHGKGALGGLRIKNVSVKGIWLFTNFCAAPLSILSAAVSGVVRGKMRPLMHTYIDIEDEQGLHWLLERNVRGARLQRCGPSGLDVDRAVDPNLPKVFLLKSVAYTTNADRPSATNQKLMELLCRDEDHQQEQVDQYKLALAGSTSVVGGGVGGVGEESGVETRSSARHRNHPPWVNVTSDAGLMVPGSSSQSVGLERPNAMQRMSFDFCKEGGRFCKAISGAAPKIQDIKRWIVNGEEHPYNLLLKNCQDMAEHFLEFMGNREWTSLLAAASNHPCGYEYDPATSMVMPGVATRSGPSSRSPTSSTSSRPTTSSAQPRGVGGSGNKKRRRNKAAPLLSTVQRPKSKRLPAYLGGGLVSGRDAKPQTTLAKKIITPLAMMRGVQPPPSEASLAGVMVDQPLGPGEQRQKATESSTQLMVERAQQQRASSKGSKKKGGAPGDERRRPDVGHDHQQVVNDLLETSIRSKEAGNPMQQIPFGQNLNQASAYAKAQAGWMVEDPHADDGTGLARRMKQLTMD